MKTPLINVYQNAIISSNGLIGLSFVIDTPSAYSLSFDDLKNNILNEIKALNILGENVYFHRCDLFEKQITKGDEYYKYDNFLNKCENKYFSGREKYKSTTIISFFLEDIETLSKSYLANPFSTKDKLHQKERDLISLFERSVNNSVGVFNNLEGTVIRPIEEIELRKFIYNIINGLNDNSSVNPASFDKDSSIGDNYIKIFSFSSPNHFSKEHSIIENDKSIPKSQFVYRGFFDDLGIYFKFPHICNQIIKIPNQETAKTKLEIRKSTYNGWKGYKKSIEDSYNTLVDFENSVNQEDNKICYAHNNIIIFSKDKKELEKATNKLSEIFSNKEVFPFDAKFQYAQNIYNSSIIGRQNELDDDFYYLTSLKDAMALSPNYGSFKDDKEGFVFQDRISNAPLITDLMDIDRVNIAARNGMFITSTGEGKSSSLLNICYQLILSNVKLVCIEFGESFGFLVKLFKDRAIQIKLRPNEPLGINTFNLHGKQIDSSKIVSVTGFILKLWRKNIELMNSEGTFFVTLQKIVKNYYDNNNQNHTMQNFFDYTINNWSQIKEDEKLKDKFFDIDEFELVLSQFVKGGLYDFVCMENDNFSNDIINSDLVVFELSEIKKDPFLLSIVLSSLEDTINTNILSDRSRLGGVIFEEFGETAELKDMFGGGDVLSSVAWLYQKIRKENGFIWTILQNIKQLPDNQYTENIISNVQLLMTLGLNEKVADDIIEKFKIKDQTHIDLMKSSKKQFDTFPKWSELFIRWGENRATVVRQEFPIEKFLAFQTDGETWDWMNKDYKQTKDLEHTIKNTIKHFNYESNNYNNSTFLE